MLVNEPTYLDLTIASYPTELYAFKDRYDCHTFLKALQSPQVVTYLERPREVFPPPELARLVSPSSDLESVALARRLIYTQKFVPEDDEQREMLASWNARKDGILARGQFFMRVLRKDMRKCQTVPYCFYPMIRQIKPEGVVYQMLDILPHIRGETERLFFALLFKFAGRSEKTFVYEKTILLDWHTVAKRNREDPNYDLYFVAADALWDFIYYLREGDHKIKYKNKDQLCTQWEAWMREKGCYTLFLNACFDFKEKRCKFERQLMIWKRFIFEYHYKSIRKPMLFC
jgi:hypothetical protein